MFLIAKIAFMSFLKSKYRFSSFVTICHGRSCDTRCKWMRPILLPFHLCAFSSHNSGTFFFFSRVTTSTTSVRALTTSVGTISANMNYCSTSTAAVLPTRVLLVTELWLRVFSGAYTLHDMMMTNQAGGTHLRRGSCWCEAIQSIQSCHAVAFAWQVKTMQQPSVSLPIDFSSYSMASVLKVLLGFLRIVRLTRNYTPRFPGRWTSFLAVLGRKFSVLWCLGLGKSGTLQRPKPPERPLFRRKASACSVCGASAISRGYVVAASTVPESANYPNTQERAVGQTTTTAPAVGMSPPTQIRSHFVDHPHAPYPPPLSHGIILAHHSSGTLGTINTQGSGSARSSIITNSGEEMHAPVASRGRFGRRQDPSRLRDGISKSASLTNALQPLHCESTDLPHLYHGDRRLSPIVQPSMSSHIPEPLGLPPMDDNRRNPSSTSVVFDVPNPSTESIPVSSTHPGQLTEAPFTIETVAPYLSPVTAAADPHDEAPILSIATLDNPLPEGRSVQLINSDQVPRYTKNLTMQVRHIVILLRLSHLLADPVSRRRTM